MSEIILLGLYGAGWIWSGQLGDKASAVIRQTFWRSSHPRSNVYKCSLQHCLENQKVSMASLPLQRAMAGSTHGAKRNELDSQILRWTNLKNRFLYEKSKVQQDMHHNTKNVKF